MHFRFFKLLATSLAACGLGLAPPAVADPVAQSQQPAPGLLATQLRTLVLRQIECRDANLAGALQYLCRKAAEQSGGAIDARYRLDIPEDLALSDSITLSLRSIPYPDALRYLGELAGVNLRIAGDAIIAEPRNSEVATPATLGPDRKPPSPKTGLSGTLARPAEPTLPGGRNLHRATGGEIQHSKSGYIKHRSAGGWSITADPHNTGDVNCSERAGCRVVRHSGACPMRGVPTPVPSPRAH